MKVTFEETGEQREVVGYCRRCFRAEPDEIEVVIVSPDGMAHRGSDYGNTLCGIDATGARWWHLS
jgi:hypothetical protein